MAAVKPMLLAPRADAPPARDRGRMLTPDDVVDLLPRKRSGKPLSRKWVRDTFLPEQRHKLGSLIYWWEADVRAYLEGDATRAA